LGGNLGVAAGGDGGRRVRFHDHRARYLDLGVQRDGEGPGGGRAQDVNGSVYQRQRDGERAALEGEGVVGGAQRAQGGGDRVGAHGAGEGGGGGQTGCAADDTGGVAVDVARDGGGEGRVWRAEDPGGIVGRHCQRRLVDRLAGAGRARGIGGARGVAGGDGVVARRELRGRRREARVPGDVKRPRAQRLGAVPEGDGSCRRARGRAAGRRGGRESYRLPVGRGAGRGNQGRGGGRERDRHLEGANPGLAVLVGHAHGHGVGAARREAVGQGTQRTPGRRR